MSEPEAEWDMRVVRVVDARFSEVDQIETAAPDLGTLPAPPLPADADLSGMSSIPFDYRKLISAAMWATDNHWAFRCNLVAILACWQQVPACSLPDDKRFIGRLVGVTGRHEAAAKAFALDGFTLCSDGRWWNFPLAQAAEKLLKSRAEHREKMRRLRGKSGAEGEPCAGHVPVEREKEREIDQPLPLTLPRAGQGDAASAKARWEQGVIGEIRKTHSTGEAERLVAAYLNNEGWAKRKFNRISDEMRAQRRAR